MSKTIFMMGALVTLAETRITCDCGTSADVADLLETKTPNRGYWTKTCKGCREVLAVSTDHKGDAVSWNHEQAEVERKRLEALPQPTEEEIAAFPASAPPCDPEAEGRELLHRMETEYQSRKTQKQ